MSYCPIFSINTNTTRIELISYCPFPNQQISKNHKNYTKNIDYKYK